MSVILKTPLFTQEIPDIGATKGHIRFTSTATSVKDIGMLCFAASIASAVLYEKVKAGGTTLIVDLSKQGAKIDVLARMDNDGMNLQWDIKPGNQKQLEEIQERIRSKTFMLMHEKKEDAPKDAVKKDAVKTDSGTPNVEKSDLSKKEDSGKSDAKSDAAKPSSKESADDEEKEDYLVKQLLRVP